MRPLHTRSRGLVLRLAWLGVLVVSLVTPVFADGETGPSAADLLRQAADALGDGDDDRAAALNEQARRFTRPGPTRGTRVPAMRSGSRR